MLRSGAGTVSNGHRRSMMDISTPWDENELANSQSLCRGSTFCIVIRRGGGHDIFIRGYCARDQTHGGSCKRYHSGQAVDFMANFTMGRRVTRDGFPTVMRSCCASRFILENGNPRPHTELQYEAVDVVASPCEDWAHSGVPCRVVRVIRQLYPRDSALSRPRGDVANHTRVGHRTTHW
jgi:hypothetical protein